MLFLSLYVKNMHGVHFHKLSPVAAQRRTAVAS